MGMARAMKLYVRENENSEWEHVDNAPEENIADIAAEWQEQGYSENNIKVEDQ